MRLFISVVGLLFWMITSAQQINLQSFNSYINNPVLVNPAAMGYNSETDVFLSCRKLWLGLDGSPRSFYITAQHNVKEKIDFSRPFTLRESNIDPFSKKYLDVKHYVGFTAAAEKFGPMSSYEGQLMYAMHVPLYDELYVSFSLAGEIGHQNYKIEELKVFDMSDNTFTNFIESGKTTLYDVNAGIFFYAKYFFGGYSAYNLLGQSHYLSRYKPTSIVRLKHVGYTGCKFRFYRSYSYLMPAVYVSYDGLYGLIYDGNLKVSINRQFWASTTYSSVKSITLTTGWQFLDYGTVLGVGYSKNFTQLGKTNIGSVEIFYGMKF